MTALGAICALGAVIVPLFAYIFVVTNSPFVWRLVTLCVCILNLIFWVIRYYVYETPKFLVTKGRLDEAAEVLKKVAARNGKHGMEFDFREVTLEQIESAGRERDSVDSASLLQLADDEQTGSEIGTTNQLIYLFNP
jgi:putative MFS transporter